MKKKAELKILEIDIASKLHDTKIDVEAIKPLIEKKYEAKKAMTLSFPDAYAKLKGVLTDKQRETLKAMKAQSQVPSFGGGGHSSSLNLSGNSVLPGGIPVFLSKLDNIL